MQCTRGCLVGRQAGSSAGDNRPCPLRCYHAPTYTRSEAANACSQDAASQTRDLHPLIAPAHTLLTPITAGSTTTVSATLRPAAANVSSKNSSHVPSDQQPAPRTFFTVWYSPSNSTSPMKAGRPHVLRLCARPSAAHAVQRRATQRVQARYRCTVHRPLGGVQATLVTGPRASSQTATKRECNSATPNLDPPCAARQPCARLQHLPSNVKSINGCVSGARPTRAGRASTRREGPRCLMAVKRRPVRRPRITNSRMRCARRRLRVVAPARVTAGRSASCACCCCCRPTPARRCRSPQGCSCPCCCRWLRQSCRCRGCSSCCRFGTAC